MASEYIPGQVIVLTDVITDPTNNNAGVDDNTDAVTVYKGDGTVLSPAPSVSHSGAAGSGTYKAQITLDATDGWWEYVFVSTGNPGAGAGRGRFFVSQVP